MVESIASFLIEFMKKNKTILIVVGTRPEVIKMAPLYFALKKESNLFNLKLCVTGQHREMLLQALNIFGIRPDVDLKIMDRCQDVIDVNSILLDKLKDVYLALKPDYVLVHGDTTSCFSAGLAAFYLSIPFGHVEAGLRTFNINSPFPEEFNRTAIAKIATHHFAPTNSSKANLIKENIPPKNIFVTGNTVVDALFFTINKFDSNSLLSARVKGSLIGKLNFDFTHSIFTLVTAHRRENFGFGINNILRALRKLATLYPNVYFVFPVHLNDNIRIPALEQLSNFKNIKLLEPLDYFSFIFLMRHSHIILSDSGGIQEEANALSKPMLIMRKNTERPEVLDAVKTFLVGVKYNDIVSTASSLIKNITLNKQSLKKTKKIYGNGYASSKIVNIIKRKLS